MKHYLLILSLIVAPLVFSSCAEYHRVTVYEYAKSKPKVISDEPRDFTPVEKF